jgi:anion-transporting  ArsA/GET3 family ATPase
VQAAPANLVAGIPQRARLHFVTGKGGTGKTTVAAALGLALADTGRNVLLIEVEGRQALAQTFDMPPMPYEEIRLATARNNGQLFGLAIDPEAAMLEYLEMFYNMKRSARGLQKIGAVDFVTTVAPGLRDVLLTGKIKEATTRTDSSGARVYDTIVVDAPPTGRIGRFLDATTEVAKLTKIGAINNQSEGVIKLLHSAETAVHIVTLLEEMPVQETIDATEELTGLGFHVGAIVVNRARPRLITEDQLAADGTPDASVIAAGLQQASINPAYAPALAQEVAEYAQRLRLQKNNLERLDELKLPRIELPDLNPPVQLGEIKQLADLFLENGR